MKDARTEAFRRGLHDLGYVEGQNAMLEIRWVEGRDERLATIMAELVALGVTVIVTSGTPAAQAAMKATRTIPIVVAAAGDFVGAGLVNSLSRPGGNVIGTSDLTADLSGKRLELLRDVVPGLSRVAVLWNGANPGAIRTWQETQEAAKTLGMHVHALDVRQLAEVDAAIATASRERAGAFVVIQDPFTVFNRSRIVQIVQRSRLPAVYGSNDFAEVGGLISYGANIIHLFYRAAGFVDRILKGARAGDLPVEQPTKFELVINMKTARALGLTIQRSLLLRADQVIE
jgi:putative ABC transport system substrate-binding protein